MEPHWMTERRDYFSMGRQSYLFGNISCSCCFKSCAFSYSATLRCLKYKTWCNSLVDGFGNELGRSEVLTQLVAQSFSNWASCEEQFCRAFSSSLTASKTLFLSRHSKKMSREFQHCALEALPAGTNSAGSSLGFESCDDPENQPIRKGKKDGERKREEGSSKTGRLVVTT
jgi:hypothetical protein